MHNLGTFASPMSPLPPLPCLPPCLCLLRTRYSWGIGQGWHRLTSCTVATHDQRTQKTGQRLAKAEEAWGKEGTSAYNSTGYLSVSDKINNRTGGGGASSSRNEWLAGLIDGDGCFQVSKKGYASLEITMDIRDEHARQTIKNIYGGSIKLRSGANALRYRLHHKSGLLSLIYDVNGHIRNSNRLIQLKKICEKYNLSLIYPDKLIYNNGWLAGFFDSDGTVTINKTNNQLTISVSQKTSELLLPLIDIYGGHVCIDNGKSMSFKWYISKRESIINILEYFKTYPPRSAKLKRLHLIPKYYELKDMKAHKALPETYLAKS
jgi:hypothetical protein